MKIVAKSIEVICWIDTKGNIKPVRFKITKEGESSSVVRIDKVICVDKEKNILVN